MKKAKRSGATVKKLQRAAPAQTTALDDKIQQYELRLYVAGQTAKSIKAFANLRKICDTHLEGKYRLEVVDLLQQPQLAAGDQILAIPTLVRRLPAPVRKIIGDLSNTDRVLVGLNLRLETED